MNRRTKIGVNPQWGPYVAAALLLLTSFQALARDHKYTGVGPNKYLSNMTMTTQVKLGDEVLTDCEVASFVGSECRSSWLSEPEQGGLVFQLIPGQSSGETLTFRVVYTDENGQEQDVLAEQTYVYRNDGIAGTPDAPYVITLPGKPKVRATYADGPTKEKDFWLSEAIGKKQDSVALATTIYIKGVWTADDYAALDGALDASPMANPCQLRYLPEDTALPAGWTNTISGTTALTDITLADGTPTAPASLYVEKEIDLDGHSVTYTRSFTLADGKSGWNSVIMPFAFKVYADDEEVSLYTTKDAKDTSGYWAQRLDYGDDENGLDFTMLTGYKKNKYKAYTPYLLAFPGNNYNIGTRDISLAGKTITLRSTEETLAETPDYLSNLTIDDTDYALIGTFTVIRKQPMYLLQHGASDEGTDAFCYSAQGSLMPFRAYLKDLTGSNAARMLTINMGTEEKAPTGMDTPKEQARTVSQPKSIYDLQGRQLNSVPRNQLIIISGKKIFAK